MRARQVIDADLEHVLQHTGKLWEAFRGRRLFMTGGTGFVGKWLLESFVHACDRHDLGAEVIILSRDPGRFIDAMPHLSAHPAVRLQQGDVRTFTFPEGVFSHVIHAATDVAHNPAPAQLLDIFDVSVQGTRRVLDFCRERGVETLLLTSSGAVYGHQPSDLEHMPETYPGAPLPTLTQSAYGEGKRAAEWLVGAYAATGGPACKIARCFACAGPYLPLDGRFAFGNFIGDRIAGRPIQVGGDGTPIRSYLYSSDLAVWLWTILIYGAPGEAYNVGSEESLSVLELAQRIAALGDSPLPVEVASRPGSKQAPERYVPATNKARQALGLATRVGLDETLRRTAAWAGASVAERSPASAHF